MESKYEIIITPNSLLQIISDTGWIPIAGNGSIDLSLNDFTKTLSCFVDCLRWQTLYFNTSVALRIKVTFRKFDFGGSEDYFEFGDGLFRTEDTRLVNFSGSTLPSNVTSVSNAAWILIKSPCARVSLELEMTVLAVSISGN